MTKKNRPVFGRFQKEGYGMMLRLLEPEDSALQFLQEVVLGISGLEKALDDIHIKTSKLRCVVFVTARPGRECRCEGP